MSAIKATINKQAIVKARSIELGRNLRLLDLVDIDSTLLANGAMLIYDASTQKFILSNRIENPDLRIIGGLY